MLGEHRIAWLALGLSALWITCAPAAAIELTGDLSTLGQVREGDQSNHVESPVDIYGDLAVNGLRHGTTLDTFFRLEHDFGSGQGPTEFYTGSMHVPGAIPGVDFTLGRQFLDEVPGGVFTADAGKIRIDPGGPVAFTVFGGQPRYFEPTYSSPLQSQDEQVFGGSVRTTHLKNASLSLGFLQQDRNGHEVRQLISGTGTQSFTTLPGLPNVYGTFAYDADRQNIDLATAGGSVFLSQPRLLGNFETSYYKPQDNGKELITPLDRREDAVFQTFSLSDLLQFRGGLRYFLTRSISAYSNCSYQRYQQLSGIFSNGYLSNVGFLWLPGGDGLEVVQTEFYVLDSSGSHVNGGKVYYENRVYDRILFRSKLDIAAYQKDSNISDTAVNGLLGVGYVLLPGLVGELDLEGNRNDRFNDDFRFGFFITYNFQHTPEQQNFPRGSGRRPS